VCLFVARMSSMAQYFRIVCVCVYVYVRVCVCVCVCVVAYMSSKGPIIVRRRVI